MRFVVAIALLVCTNIVYAVSANLTWDANPSSQQITKYQCEYQINAGPFVVCDMDIIGTSYVQIVLGVISGDEIGFRLRACNVIGCSTFTQTKVGVVPPDVAPDEPVNFKILLVIE